MKSILSFGFLFVLSSSAFAGEIFCGFFVDRSPVEVTLNLGARTAKVEASKQKTDFRITAIEQHGYSHGPMCDDSMFCSTGVTYTLESEMGSLKVTDSYDAASIFGQMDGKNLVADGHCE